MRRSSDGRHSVFQPSASLGNDDEGASNTEVQKRLKTAGSQLQHPRDEEREHILVELQYPVIQRV